MTQERWHQLTYWPLIITSLIFIVVYSWQVIADLQGPAYAVARVVIAVTWVVFAVDYIVRLALADPRGKWFRGHLFDLAVVAIPALRPLRLLRALTVVKTLQRTAGSAIRNRVAIYGAGAAAILIWIAALAVLEAERGAPGANIENFGDAVWWAFVTITTVGYGDFYPVTWWGRVVAVLLMCGGIAVVGVVTATVSSWVIERAAATVGDDTEPATRGQVRELSRQLTAVSAKLGDPPAR
ncbi:potassium channel family protein [Microbacterium sp. ET2]|uniref:potassium channel family protein n=1 Tax=Microbacterium albipurpureum TaxID=3050384 RepID=UPI00259CD30C|nr:potassium channel family protein [Microbacterium sp. ET2 (Ac-2212)]WJL94344.1 potassium channel family protein [Microbacterium sp. ET2 (Ac-2212)]